MSRIDRFAEAWKRHRHAAARRRALRQQNTLEKPRYRGGGWYGGDVGGGC